MDKYDILDQTKRPVGLKKHVGIEIEFVSPFEDYKIQDLLVKHNLHANCTLKDDASIDNEFPLKKPMPEYKHECDEPGWTYATISGYDLNGYAEYKYHACSGCKKEQAWENKYTPRGEAISHEMTILTTEADLRSILNKVNIVLKKCKAQVNHTCGLHVHLDMRNRDFKKSVSRLLAKQKEFQKMVAKNRLEDTHCRPLTKQEVKSNGGGTRYKDINMQAFEKFGTVEIRIHEGCVNVHEIFNWCRYLIAVVDNKKVSQTYVKRRIEQCA